MTDFGSSRVGAVLFRFMIRPAFVSTRDWLVGLLEWKNGIRTAGIVELSDIGVDGPERARYKPAPWLTIRRSLPRRRAAVDNVFLDLGSGMGRVVCQAALWYPFKRVTGVELSSDLHRIAERNIDHNRHRLRCRQVQLVNSDVLDFAVPDDVTVVFLNNPFNGKTFSTVVSRLLASVDANPRPLRLIYFNPVEHEHLMATGRFRLVKRVRGWRPGRQWALSNATHVYETWPDNSDVTQRCGATTGTST